MACLARAPVLRVCVPRLRYWELPQFLPADHDPSLSPWFLPSVALAQDLTLAVSGWRGAQMPHWCNLGRIPFHKREAPLRRCVVGSRLAHRVSASTAVGATVRGSVEADAAAWSFLNGIVPDAFPADGAGWRCVRNAPRPSPLLRVVGSGPCMAQAPDRFRSRSQSPTLRPMSSAGGDGCLFSRALVARIPSCSRPLPSSW